MQAGNFNRAGLDQVRENGGGDVDQERRAERSEGKNQTPDAAPAPFLNKTNSAQQKNCAEKAKDRADENQRNENAIGRAQSRQTRDGFSKNDQIDQCDQRAHDDIRVAELFQAWSHWNAGLSGAGST